MKTIPSLVASSTVGVAATGLVFGQPLSSSQERPISHKRKLTDYDAQFMTYSTPPTRPATSSHPRAPLPDHTTVSTPLESSARDDYFSRFSSHAHSQAGTPSIHGHGTWTGSTGKHADPVEALVEERHSISSKGSWMRRLSYIATSQHGSPRSSIGPDSPSITFSHGSAAPILHTNFSPVHQEPNKLVKRAPSVRGTSGHAFSNPTSNQRMPTLRRPATSHQRSITLQQQYHEAETSQPRTPTEDSQFPIMHEFAPTQKRAWRPYFESCPTRMARERHASSSADIGKEGFYSMSKRVLIPDGVLPTLLTPSMIDKDFKHASKARTRKRSSTVGGESGTNYPTFQTQPEIIEEEPEKQARQSISLHLGSPTTWLNKTGSLRIKKGRDSGSSSIRRALSVPLSASPPVRANISHDASTYKDQEGVSGRRFNRDSDLSDGLGNLGQPLNPDNSCNSSTLPPISRLSSFNVDYGGSSRSTSNGTSSKAPSSTNPSHELYQTPRTLDGRSRALSSHPVILHQNLHPKLNEVHNSDQGSTLVGSESDLKGIIHVEEEEIDFQSDTAFDSYRTGATASIRARSAALDSMFDESPPSSGSRTKMADFHEGALFPPFHNGDQSIVEEEENMETPVKARRRVEEDMHQTPTREIVDFGEKSLRSSPPAFPSRKADLCRLSSGDDDDFDEDWTRDEDEFTLTNHLSPPSNSTNSQRAGKAFRAALAGHSDFERLATEGERPRSVFDWSENYMHEKLDVMGNSPRPSTVHGKQLLDMRGGRTVGRARPTALHIRSQSVPAVPDINGQRDPSNIVPKFGTWGLGAKGVSEDWDNDFEFDSSELNEENGKSLLNRGSAMVVPPAIQASQASVVGHVGQIREVCLLVEDLRRLRGLAREKGIIDGPSADKWREAEGIIALAIPDEEDETLSPPLSPMAPSPSSHSKGIAHRPSMSMDSFSIHEAAMNHEYHNKSDHAQRSTAGTRRQSILTIEDDIFGLGLPRSSSDTQRSKKRRAAGAKDNTDVARSVMENMHQHRASSDPVLAHAISEKTSKMPFDTTSLRDLVQRANALTRALSEIIRKADGFTHSPHHSPELARDASPAFTRVFTDPAAGPMKGMPRSQSDTAMLKATIDSSPTRNLSQRMHMMAVV